MKKLLVYTCCDKKYETFIPLYCLSLLRYNEDICIEIGIQDKVSENTKNAIDILSWQYGGDCIKLTSIPFSNMANGYISYNGHKMLSNTLRFVTVPTCKAEYVYISDIDIICMESILECHLKHMREIGKKYSNIVRPDTMRLTGLHFSEYGFYYPFSLDGIDLSINDEMVLYKIVSKKTEIDHNTSCRPVHGIHMSLNRPTVKGDDKIPGWGATPFREKWIGLMDTDIYKQISRYFEGEVIGQIQKLNEFYGIQNETF